MHEFCESASRFGILVAYKLLYGFDIELDLILEASHATPPLEHPARRMSTLAQTRLTIQPTPADSRAMETAADARARLAVGSREIAAHA